MPEWSLSEVLSFASTEGFATVEAMCWPVGRAERRFAGVTHIDVDAITPARADDIRGECDARGVELSGLGYYPNMLDPDPAVSAAAIRHFSSVIVAAAERVVHDGKAFYELAGATEVLSACDGK